MRYLLVSALCGLVACVNGAGGPGKAGGSETGDDPASQSPDSDGDGSPDYLDCAADDPSVSPLSEERCDALDNDCDGEVDEDAVDATVWYVDGDGDGFGADAYMSLACEAPEGTSGIAGDCDDTDEDVSPEAHEVCGGGDEDCDGEEDEEDTIDFDSYFVDRDGDGYGDASVEVEACELPEGFSTNDNDCDDDDVDIHPGATERCDGVDQDCDSTVDEYATDVTWYTDQDRDGYGKTSGTTCRYGVAGYSLEGGDCDDTDATVWPEAEELCDGEDNDCDGVVDDEIDDMPTWYVDADSDGYGDADGLAYATCSTPRGYTENRLDCDDSSSKVSPDGVESCSNGVDDDCDGAVDPCAPVELSGTAAGDYLGWATLGGEDWDGDGAGDALVSAYLMNADGADSGRIYRLAGPLIEGASLSTAAVLTGTKGLELGAALASAGDLDGDGLVDLLVGGTGESTSGDGAGAAWIVPGPLDSETRLTDALGVVRGAAAGDGLGRAISAGGDLDGDGLGDLALGAEDSDRTTADGGAVWVYAGGWTGDELAGASATAVLGGGAAGDSAGHALDLGGDLDGDGLADLAVGAPNVEVGSTTNTGLVYIFDGPITGEVALSDADETITGYRYSQTGYSVAQAGDLTGDGLDDLLVGARHDDRGASNAGSAAVLDGPVSTGLYADAAATFYGDSASDSAGTSVCGVGDLDGDGQPEIAFGGPEDADGGVDAGAVWVVYGPVVSSDVALKVTGSRASAALGMGLGPTGDLGGDGLDDLLIGAPKDSASLSKAGALFYISGF